MQQAKTSMIFRIDPDLKKAFEKVATERDLTASQMLRRFVRETVGITTNEQKEAPEPLKPSGHSKPSAKQKKPAKNAANAIMAQIKRGI